jgi:RNA polymerase sigma-70 factor (ECF subfamily)
LYKLEKEVKTSMVTIMAYEPAGGLSEEVESAVAVATVEEQETAADVLTEQHLLVVRALHGDSDAFDDVVERYRGMMLRLAYSIVRDQDIAEDAVQNAIIQAWQHLPTLREAGALRSWLMRIVVNQCISFKRRLARSAQFLQQAYAGQETERAFQIASDAEGVMEGHWDLARAIEKLPAKQQQVINLHYYQGMTLPEMAQMLRTSQNTLKKRIQSALARLREVLRSAEIDDAIFAAGPRSPGGW